MSYGLLIDFDVLELARSLPKARQQRLYAYFSVIKNYPRNCSHFVVQDKVGRTLQVAIFEDYFVQYWIDNADRHIKILRMEENE